MMLSLFGSFVAVGWWYVCILVHSLNLYDGNNGFLECVDVQKILNMKNRRPITHNVITMIKIVLFDVTSSVSLLISLNCFICVHNAAFFQADCLVDELDGHCSFVAIRSEHFTKNVLLYFGKSTSESQNHS